MKHETGSRAGALVVVLHGINQATGGAHDGQGSVALAVHLAQPARLVARRHEQKVTARLDPVGQAVIKTDIGVELVAPALADRREEIFRVRVARTQQDHL